MIRDVSKAPHFHMGSKGSINTGGTGTVYCALKYHEPPSEHGASGKVERSLAAVVRAAATAATAPVDSAAAAAERSGTTAATKPKAVLGKLAALKIGVSDTLQTDISRIDGNDRVAGLVSVAVGIAVVKECLLVEAELLCRLKGSEPWGWSLKPQVNSEETFAVCESGYLMCVEGAERRTVGDVLQLLDAACRAFIPPPNDPLAAEVRAHAISVTRGQR